MAVRRTSGEGWAFISDDVPDIDVEVLVSRAPEEQRIRISLEKRKRGKVVTLAGGLVLAKGDLKDLARALREACGTGGTIRGETIELQGDCRRYVRAWLMENGWGLR